MRKYKCYKASACAYKDKTTKETTCTMETWCDFQGDEVKSRKIDKLAIALIAVLILNVVVAIGKICIFIGILK